MNALVRGGMFVVVGGQRETEDRDANAGARCTELGIRSVPRPGRDWRVDVSQVEEQDEEEDAGEGQRTHC